MRLIEDDRSAVVWLNYKRVTPENVDPYTPMGPNLIGEYLWPVEATNKTIGFSYIEPIVVPHA